MKIITTLYEVSSIKKLNQYVDGYVVGNSSFSTRLTKSFSIDEINYLINTSKEIFVLMNKMFTDHELSLLTSQVIKISNKVCGFIVADIGVMELLRELGFGSKVIYNPETLLTNHFDFNYYSQDLIKGAFVAKEITLQDVIKIGQEKKYEMFFYGHGYLNMFYSKRKLITNYFAHLDKQNPLTGNLKIIEEKRVSTPYPILEDLAGTHVFRANVYSSINEFFAVSQFVDYFMIDTIFHNDEYLERILPLYTNAFHQDEIKKIEEEYQETWDDGFLNKKTIYQMGGEND